jgi:hypothetical protein
MWVAAHPAVAVVRMKATMLMLLEKQNILCMKNGLNETVRFHFLASGPGVNDYLTGGAL